jgi:hypothetical protein
VSLDLEKWSKWASCFWRDDDVFVLYFVLENNVKREREREREREYYFEQSLLVLNNPVWRFLG